MRFHEFNPILSEAALTPAALFEPKYLEWRPVNFLKKLKDRTPFVDKDGNVFANSAKPVAVERDAKVSGNPSDRDGSN